MKGNIYSRQRCPVCDGKLIHDERRDGCFCFSHPQVAATGDFSVRKESNNYSRLSRMLNGLRFKTDEKSFDARDYAADNPLAFNKLVDEYMEEKEGRGLATVGDIRTRILTAVGTWGDRNVKTIKRRDIKLFLKGLKVSDKTRHNYLSTIRDFYAYLVDEELILKDQVPTFPKIEFELGYRKITDWETQQAIMDKLKDLTWHINEKIWFGCELLRTHTNMRPGDLLRLTEVDINTDVGVILVWRPTKKKNQRKTVRMTPDETDLARELKRKYPALPNVKFFRHHGGIQSIRPGQPFGNKYLYKWWKRACAELGIQDLDLYGGTRHTTTTELAIRFGEEAAKDASEHETNKAFERYCQMQGERAYDMALLVKGKGKPNTSPIPIKDKRFS